MLQKKRDKTTEGSDRYGIAGGCSLGSTVSNAFQVGWLPSNSNPRCL